MSENKQCPLKFASPNRLDWGVDCVEELCALWEKRCEMCSLKVQGYFLAFEYSKKERYE